MMRPNIDFPDLVANGEHPNGAVQVTPNGIARDVGPGHNRQFSTTQNDIPYVERYEEPATGVWGRAEIDIKGKKIKGGMANRTGE